MKKVSWNHKRSHIIKVIAVTSFIWLALDIALFYSTGFMSERETRSQVKLPVEKVKTPRVVADVHFDYEVNDYDEGFESDPNQEEGVQKHDTLLEMLQNRVENRVQMEIDAEEINARQINEDLFINIDDKQKQTIALHEAGALETVNFKGMETLLEEKV